MPLRCSLSSGLDPGRSVPCLRRISYCCGVNCARHSASVFSISNFSPAFAGEARSQRNAARPKRLAIDASKIRRSIMMVSGRRESGGPPSNTRRGGRSYTDPEGFFSLCCDYRTPDAVQPLAFAPPRRLWPARRRVAGWPRSGLAVYLRQTRLANTLPRPRSFAVTGQPAGSGGTSSIPHPDEIAGDPAGCAAGPDQFERRKQPPAFVAPQNAAGDQLPRHRRRVQALTAEAACYPQSPTQLADLRHAVHGVSGGTAPYLGNLRLSQLGKNRVDPARDDGRETFRPCGPGGFRASPHQAVAVHDAEMIDAVGIGHRSLECYCLREALVERRGHGRIAPDRQQRFRQSPQCGAQMNVPGKHDMGGAQTRRRRDDAFANPGRIDADDGGVLKNPRSRPSRQRRQAMDVSAAVDLKRVGIIDTMKITIRLELGTHAVDLPSLHVSLKILAEHLQPADQLIADIDIGDLQRPLADGNARILRRIGPNQFGAVLRQRPEFAGIFEADARDQLADRKRITRHYSSELMARRVPADVPALENGDAGAKPRGLQRHRQPGKPRPDHGDINIQVERKARAVRRCCGVLSDGRADEALAHIVFLRAVLVLVTFLLANRLSELRIQKDITKLRF